MDLLLQMGMSDEDGGAILKSNGGLVLGIVDLIIILLKINGGAVAV